MASPHTGDWIRRFDAAEENICVVFNRWSARKSVRALFATVSRLGDGILWYTLILTLPLYFGWQASWRTLQFAVTGLFGVAIYKAVKHRFVRERPYISHLIIRVGIAPLDRYSFPSGHTLHAVSFAILFTAYFPALGWLVIPFATLVAVSRIVLGLHYPTDIAVGAAMGAGMALGSIAVFG
jgi:undecaprenyl-diphosphatase